MGRRSHYNKTSLAVTLSKCIMWLLILLLFVFAGCRLLKKADFNPNNIVENSVLKNETFATNVQEISSREGIKAYYFEDHTNPIISISFMFKNAGRAFDVADEFGIANMAAALLSEGAGEFNSKELKDKLEDVAISVSFSSDNDGFYGSLKTLKENQKEAFNLLNIMLTQPRFDGKDVERVQGQMLAALKQQEEYPEAILEVFWAKEIYGEHPYGRNSIGEKNAIKNINKEKLQAFVKNNFNKEDLVVGIAGDISKVEAEKMLDKAFGGLPEKGGQAFVKNAELKFDGREKNISLPLPQSMAVFATVGVKRNHPDFYPLFIANQILGGSGLTSRLSLAAREDKALTYGVYSYLSMEDKAELIRGGFSASPQNFDKVKEIVKNEWLKIAESGVTEKEFVQAKNYLIASYNLRFSSLAQISTILLLMQKENLGIDFLQKRNELVKAVTKEEVDAAAAKYFGQNNLVWVNLGNLDNNKE